MRWLDGITDTMDMSLTEGSGAGGVQTAKASRKQSTLSGKESARTIPHITRMQGFFWGGDVLIVYFPRGTHPPHLHHNNPR